MHGSAAGLPNDGPVAHYGSNREKFPASIRRRVNPAPCGIFGPMQTFWVMFFVVPLALVGLAALVSLRTGRRED